MRSLLSRFAILFFCLLSANSGAQEAFAIDSIRARLGNAITTEEKFMWLETLSRTLMNVNIVSADSAGARLIEFAEGTRDRKLMVRAYLSNGIRCGYLQGNRNRALQAIGFFEKALQIARAYRLDEETGGCLLLLASVHLSIPDREKALNYANQAASIISSLENDSLLAQSQNVFGHIYLLRKEKILALRSYLNALRIAEELNNHPLLRICYAHLSRFYASLDAYDRAIDYAMEAYKQLDHIKEGNVAYQRVIDMTTIGTLYSRQKNYDIAISYFERSIAMADTLRFSALKVPGYLNLFNQYLRRNQPEKALEFFNSPRGKSLKTRFSDFGMSHITDQAYGITYTALKRFDSARFYLERAEPSFNKTADAENKMYFYSNLGKLYKEMGEHDHAISIYLHLKNLADSTGSLEYVEHSAFELDTLYAAKENYKEARKYNRIYIKYKDSLAILSKEKELAQEEAVDEQLRQQRLLEEQAEQTRRRNNIQYLAITLGIVGLFVALVVLGMFRVSASVIRALGFFTFLLFFEFIFLIFKKNIYGITHGEPWKDLAFMIALAALLVPLHHILEKKVLGYLTSHNRLTRAGAGIRQRIFHKSGPGES